MASVVRGNLSSTDNTLAFPVHPNSREPTQSFANSATSIATTNTTLQSPVKYYSSEKSNLRATPTKFYDTDKYLKSNQFNSASNNQEFVNNSTNQFESGSNGFNYSKKSTTSSPQVLQSQRSPSQSDLRFDVDFYNKQAYKNALDQQVIEKELTRFEQLRENKKSELETLSQYPFGRRTDPNSYIIGEARFTQPFVNMTSYHPDFYNARAPFYRDDSNAAPKLDKNNIFEKPNSLSADIPPYGNY